MKSIYSDSTASQIPPPLTASSLLIPSESLPSAPRSPLEVFFFLFFFSSLFWLANVTLSRKLPATRCVRPGPAAEQIRGVYGQSPPWGLVSVFYLLLLELQLVCLSAKGYMWTLRFIIWSFGWGCPVGFFEGLKPTSRKTFFFWGG